MEPENIAELISDLVDLLSHPDCPVIPLSQGSVIKEELWDMSEDEKEATFQLLILKKLIS